MMIAFQGAEIFMRAFTWLVALLVLSFIPSIFQHAVYASIVQFWITVKAGAH